MGLRISLFTALSTGDGVHGFPLEEARKQTDGLMRIIKRELKKAGA